MVAVLAIYFIGWLFGLLLGYRYGYLAGQHNSMQRRRRISHGLRGSAQRTRRGDGTMTETTNG